MQNSQGRLKNFGDKNCLSSSFTSRIHPPVEKSNNYVMLESRDQRLPGLRRCLQFAASPGYEVANCPPSYENYETVNTKSTKYTEMFFGKIAKFT